MPFYKIPISEMWVICLIFDVCLRLRVKKKSPGRRSAVGFVGGSGWKLSLGAQLYTLFREFQQDCGQC